MGERTKNAEIAFFGGSFTAIDREYMLSLLEATVPFIGRFAGIRLSTRPDCIDEDVLILLKKYNVTVIELGAQSMSDEVLLSNERGHNSDDVRNACKLIKQYGFSLGLQMMTGLYKSTEEIDMYTAREFVKLSPECVRIYPTVTMRNTRLASLYESGEYEPYSLEKSVNLVARIMELFCEENIDVIRVGLHYSDSLAENDLAGNYHPAFRELCEGRIFLDRIILQVEKLNISSGTLELSVNPRSVSKLIGQNKRNIEFLNQKGFQTKVLRDESLDRYDVKVKVMRCG